MSFKTMLKSLNFWKSVFWLGFSFLILYNIISMLFEYGSFDFSLYFSERTENGKLLRFIIGQFLAAFAYGFILSLGQFRINQKKQ
ncbi:hypothetical protein [Gramella sp. AN32]|uniref:Uncharacterized protein n=1 Tax=Christiangramia antarctica TaxID=2058158 RepID=A0ABW5X5G6_9FLAO|nr:hypothetical protein [Gramella sp. AN32]MCM4157196.1 hypothetical protein [Gramella sp. AN32]